MIIFDVRRLVPEFMGDALNVNLWPPVTVRFLCGFDKILNDVGG